MKQSRNPIDLGVERDSHREALEAFIATAGAFDDVAFNAPRGPGAWSPAQVTEHLRLTYVVILAELEGTGGFRIRTSWWQQRLFRLLYLPRILRRGDFPRGVRATREIRPGDGPFDKAGSIAALRAVADRFLQAVSAAVQRPGTVITHPFLGRIGVLAGLRFTTQHIRHHHQQVMPQRA